jgi:hypothetical protein
MEMAINKPSFKEALDKKTLIKTKSKILTPADIAAEYFGIA